jgi:hypothetical protein
MYNQTCEPKEGIVPKQVTLGDILDETRCILAEACGHAIGISAAVDPMPAEPQNQMADDESLFSKALALREKAGYIRRILCDVHGKL